MSDLVTDMKNALAARRAAGLLRTLPPPLSGSIDFCSNDYLGYARRIRVAEPGGGGATGSRLISGNTVLAETLETEIATFHGAEAALLFSSGYAANIGLVPALARRGDHIVYDALIHASLHDGIRLSKAEAHRFAHNDLADLEQKLRRTASTGRTFVIVESVYSMDGDQAPLREITEICARYGAPLIVDEAHGTGVLGERGEGLVGALSLEDRITARVHTFGKAVGGHGAAVVGSQLLKDYLMNFARSFIYATGLPAHALRSIQAAYRAMATGEATRRLRERVDFFLTHCPPDVRARLLPSTTPVQALIHPGNAEVTALARALQAEGYALLPIRSPTVPRGTERLRICLHTFNTDEEILGLLAGLERHL